ncbi:hypothetical protein IBE48_08595 [Francisella philomiragia]|uniref:Uncharacterized protein n=1 Tax=Francisella philomiragia TaxID=28110 RepID=A0AAW3DDW0_9GAMM|nr:hypothetical protein [Francisella philomiragia]KFJ43823.1 hypothetical protein DR78_1458 [Francisella philomiragia]MBK2255453.1 hypothetical protein [Francisella philomiragia]MBK2273807.1 hypothetical protein [Francisella philomiragia]MBK2277647.1 hypothetical protein [Francisella philomiragia]MBK2281566.1 hypothetical protein [Francisella philomiragia]
MNELIKELEQILLPSRLSTSGVVHAMSNMRLIINKKKLESKYNILNLYCNWILHDSITASNTALRILERLTDSMILHNAGDESKWINDSIVEGFNIHTLQQEMIFLADELNIEIVGLLKTKSYWKDFVRILIKKLIGRPLKFPDKPKYKAKEIQDSIISKTVKSGSDANGVLSICFIKHNNSIFWKMETIATKKKSINLIGPMSIVTQEMVDNYNLRRG